jgi:hypothetical protein
VDDSILKCATEDSKIMDFYFDKYNMKFSDLNPFCENSVPDLSIRKSSRLPKDEYSVY